MTYPRRKPIQRQSLHDIKRANFAAHEALAAISGQPNMMAPVAEPKRRAVKPPTAAPEPSEAQILKACYQTLAVHPLMSAAWRVNSGTFTEGNADGTTRYVRANTMSGMSDLAGFTKAGQSVFIECKSRKGRLLPHQLEFLQRSRAAGCIAGVARSADDVIRLLSGEQPDLR